VLKEPAFAAAAQNFSRSLRFTDGAADAAARILEIFDDSQKGESVRYNSPELATGLLSAHLPNHVGMRLHYDMTNRQSADRRDAAASDVRTSI